MTDPKKCSAKEAERWIPRTRQTIVKYIQDDGAPCVNRPDPGKRRGEWLIDVPAFISWLIDHEKEKAVQAAVKKIRAVEEEAGEGGISKEEAQRRKAVADALIREIELDEAAKRVIPRDQVLEVVAREYNAVRTALYGIPSGACEEVAEIDDPAVVADLLRKKVDEAMERLQADTKGVVRRGPDAEG